MFIFLCDDVLHVALKRTWKCNEPLYELWSSREFLLQFLYNIFTELRISLKLCGPVETFSDTSCWYYFCLYCSSAKISLKI